METKWLLWPAAFGGLSDCQTSCPGKYIRKTPVLSLSWDLKAYLFRLRVMGGRKRMVESSYIWQVGNLGDTTHNSYYQNCQKVNGGWGWEEDYFFPMASFNPTCIGYNIV